ncbi:carboxypeptidase-like regulatory domain-containing protein [Tunicatimonas pelagia]|uniref:carboxypeptidase-like regulatory domain-containing protein n=1 Tax=Tunicatimonas pelagia TaxID=931531 RepID=UPI002666A333|nr:carboxypeptidase-like regulatory domain-containing protein [Tunicatimonas pelagia]WKN43582.1 carboxypeptidase-like regulatory domain-containing protein [Tunicatimonas pelagia]
MPSRNYCGLLCLILLNSSAYAQLLVRGQITSRTGEELPFVHVINSSLKKVSVSGINGLFSIDAISGDTLKFSLVGYQPERIIVNDEHFQQLQQVVLVEDSILLPGITVFDRAVKPIITAPKRESMTVRFVRGKEDIVSKKPIRFEPGVEGGLPPGQAGGTLTGVFTRLHDRFSKNGKERRKYAKATQQTKEEAKYYALINDEKTIKEISQQFQLSLADYERLMALFKEQYPDAKRMTNKNEIIGLLYYFFSQNKK